MPSKAPIQRVQPPQAPTISGKWLIIGVVTVALTGALGSWIFRYYATHRAAELWGSQVSQLIRDAPVVEFRKIEPPLTGEIPTQDRGPIAHPISGPGMTNITAAPGLVHLRNALVEDRSFEWPAVAPRSDDVWRWVMVFRDDSTRAGATVLFSPNGDHAVSLEAPQRVASTKPIADGLRQMFAEFVAMQPETTPANDSPASESVPSESQPH